MVVVKVGVALQGGEVGAPVAVVVGVGGAPDLALLASPGGALILVAEAPSTASLLLLVGGHPGATVRKVAVVAPATHEGLVGMGVVAATLHAHLVAHRGWGLVGGAGG